ncbi:MAG: DUF308 domain-containing protein [Bacteroidales bacterium]|nr:DUF308 domain-containing protein [Bacteroidales bacterium]
MSISSLFNKVWKTILVNGILSTLFGVILLFVESDILGTIIKSFGIILVVLSVLLLCIDFIHTKKDIQWGGPILQYIIYLIVGILCIVYHTKLSNIAYIAFGIWIAISGIYLLISTIRFSNHIPRASVNIVTSIMLTILGLYLMFYPNHAHYVITKIIGVFLTVSGIWQIYSTFRFKRIPDAIQKSTDDSEVTKD